MPKSHSGYEVEVDTTRSRHADLPHEMQAVSLLPQHGRMRAFGRDLIRGGHYGQRSCEPHLKAEHMAHQPAVAK